ncbi:MAG: FAD-binding oxidoreductase [Pseudanabaenaceae cyanobacterium]
MLSQLPPNLIAIDAFWAKFRKGELSPVEVIRDRCFEQGKAPDYDVIICGGSLGILFACALQIRGWRVVVIEKNVLQGREQEWNISQSELNSLLELELMTPGELDRVITTVYNPGRIAFHGGSEFWVKDILNLGVSPRLLIEQVKQRFLRGGGIILEYTQFHTGVVFQNSVAVTVVQQGGKLTLTGKVLVDAMGHFSPIVQQFYANQADSVCMVVGGCADGLPDYSYGDLIYTFTPALPDQSGKLRQYFWEAFPAHDGRTTYLFVYLQKSNWDLSFQELWQTYISLLPQYQQAEPANIQLHRQLMGFFPAYKNSPLVPKFNRLLFVGDSSGMQSPLSFGGFGAMLRHLPRLTEGLHLALSDNYLTQADLKLLLPYQPNLAVTWLFQQAMSNPSDPDQINRLMNCTFQVMSKLGPQVITPFLKDTVQFLPLSLTMLNMMWTDPLLILNVMGTVGINSLLAWLKHYLSLAYYHFVSEFPASSPENFYQLVQQQALLYGSGRR